MDRRIPLSNKDRAAVGLVAAVFVLASLSEISSVVLAGEQNIMLNCTQQNQATTCVCEVSPAAEAVSTEITDTAIMSESSSGITIQCPATNFEFVPSDTKSVCTAEANGGTLKECKESGKKTMKSPIQGLLTNVTDTNSPAWTETTDKDKKNHSLTFPTETFPLVDRTFFAGCSKTDQDLQNGKECVVNVTVKARTSAVNDGVLTCAYGTESNSSVPEVTLNSGNNSLTILCGNEGQMRPTKESFTAYHCAGSNTDGCTIANLTEIMPGFASSWWTTDEQNSNAPKLVIPADGFPAQEETIVLGCNPNNNVTGTKRDEQGGETTSANLPTCKVKLTLAASTSMSQAPSVSFRGLFVLVFVPPVLLGI
uniref:SRS domain-containing protein n=1 Tax=Neospora caninum (strain Liverpool) TaxID=572307 RepID=F0JAZ8_NEOCL|nr:SRS domain-containing protein [Neospora caninum Liverpool]CEL71264.1 TPA: SRS domain-containing protein [Neospora caninum Liverpool]